MVDIMVEIIGMAEFTVTLVNFTNILRKAFTLADPKSEKTDSLTAFFALLGTVGILALHKMLMKLTIENGDKKK
jgi:hypothetical protein